MKDKNSVNMALKYENFMLYIIVINEIFDKCNYC